jgi:hypothetical protein
MACRTSSRTRDKNSSQVKSSQVNNLLFQKHGHSFSIFPFSDSIEWVCALYKYAINQSINELINQSISITLQTYTQLIMCALCTISINQSINQSIPITLLIDQGPGLDSHWSWFKKILRILHSHFHMHSASHPSAQIHFPCGSETHAMLMSVHRVPQCRIVWNKAGNLHPDVV